MLDLDLDLEADLGVDTVKQAEMFAAIREIYGIPRDENRKLRDYPTLAHVIRFVFEKRPDLAGTAVAASSAPTPSLQLLVLSGFVLNDVDRTGQAFPLPQRRRNRVPTIRSRKKFCRSWPKRLAIRKTCWTLILTWKRTSALTPSNRRRCLRRCGQPTTFRAMKISSCAISRLWRM